MTGSARPLIAWAAFLLTLLCVVLAVVTMRANGLLLLGTVFLAIGVWATGAYRWSWWCADDETSRRLTAVDEELDFIDSVITDVEQLDRR